MTSATLPSVAQHGEIRPGAMALLLGLMALAWLLWPGIFTLLVLALGAGSCVLRAILAQRMGFFRHRGLFAVVPGLPRSGHRGWVTPSWPARCLLTQAFCL